MLECFPLWEFCELLNYMPAVALIKTLELIISVLVSFGFLWLSCNFFRNSDFICSSLMLIFSQLTTVGRAWDSQKTWWLVNVTGSRLR